MLDVVDAEQGRGWVGWGVDKREPTAKVGMDGVT